MRAAIAAALAAATVSAQAQPPISFWPLPVGLNFGAGSVFVDPAVRVVVNPATPAVSDYAAWLMGRYVFVQQPGGPAPAGAVGLVTINIANPTAPLEIAMDESYTLSVPAAGAIVINANTTSGAYWALQTLSQAIRFDFESQQYAVQGVPLAITDAPKFGFRSLLIDTDRHWQSLHYLLRIVDSMAFAKLNVLHLHVVDWQSWPLQSVAYPGLWNASWSKRERYTFNDMRTLVAYANARGIVVLPEFDTPGHATSMCTAYPELCCSASGCGAGNNNPLSPVPDASGRNVTLDAIKAVLTEMASIFPGEFLHLGGDEVDESCWKNSPEVVKWMQAQGFNSADQIYEYFVAEVDKYSLAMNRAPIRWSEVWQHFGTDLDPRTVIHAWLGTTELVQATNAGYRAIWSIDGKYYLDALGENWTAFYNVDILGQITNTSAIPLVIGGETCMWGETADGSDVLQTIWPRAAAAAERQWSYNAAGGSASAPGVADRLQAFRCLMLERGIPAAPVTNPTARQGPTGPGSCTMQ